MISYEEAFATITDDAQLTLHRERLPLKEALGRVIAQDCHAPINVPGYDNSAMDGYAVRTADIALGIDYNVSQRIPAGSVPDPLAAASVARIFTGAMVPDGADAIILQEDAVDKQQQVSFTELPKPRQHIRDAGQDIASGAVVAACGQRLSAGDIGLLASVGIDAVECFSPLRVAFFSTGDELKNPGEELAAGQIYNSNRYFLAATIAELGAIPVDLGCCPDTPEATRAMLERASAEADCIVTTGGMSVGEEDHVKAQVEALGKMHFWKIAIKPGKPVAFASVNDTPFFGLPGNPVSSFVTFHLFVRPWLLKVMGYSQWRPQRLSAVAQFKKHNGGGRLDFLRGVLSADNDGSMVVDLFSNQSSGVLSSIAASNVLVPLAPGQQLDIGDHCEVIPLSAFGQLSL